MIAFWPKHITKERGKFSDCVGHVMDFMKTFCELAEITYPTKFAGHDTTPSSGNSLVPTFRGESVQRHRELYNEHFGARYARMGQCKLVSLANDSTKHLYNLTSDKTETTDLSSRYPEKVRELDQLWMKWVTTHQVFPKPGR